MDAASIANLRAAMEVDAGSIDADVVDVWPEHWDIVQAFLASATQWRVVGLGGGFEPSRIRFIGFDYAAVRAGLGAEEIQVSPDLWRGLRVMESAACAALNEVD